MAVSKSFLSRMDLNSICEKCIVRYCRAAVFQAAGAQRAKFAENVHKLPLWVNVINIELSRLDASI